MLTPNFPSLWKGCCLCSQCWLWNIHIRVLRLRWDLSIGSLNIRDELNQGGGGNGHETPFWLHILTIKGRDAQETIMFYLQKNYIWQSHSPEIGTQCSSDPTVENNSIFEHLHTTPSHELPTHHKTCSLATPHFDILFFTFKSSPNCTKHVPIGKYSMLAWCFDYIWMI